MASQTSEVELVRFSSDSKSAKSENIYKTVCQPCSQKIDGRKDSDKKRLIIVSIVCLVFMTAEAVGGIMSNSLAIASDAAHLLTDFGAFMVSLTAIWIASKPPTSKMLFGYHRAEVIGALISVLSIWLITGILVYMAIQRIIYPSYELKAVVMIYVSIGGIFANLIMGLILMTVNGNLHHSFKPSNSESLTIRSALIHIFGDFLQSVGVLVASVVIYFYPHLKIIDPICTFFFSAIVLFTTFSIMIEIFRVLMEGFPEHLDFLEVKEVLKSIQGVVKIHSLRMWCLTMDKVALSAHIVVKEGENQSLFLKRATQIIGDKLNVFEITLQLEDEDFVSVCTTDVHNCDSDP